VPNRSCFKKRERERKGRGKKKGKKKIEENKNPPKLVHRTNTIFEVLH